MSDLRVPYGNLKVVDHVPSAFAEVAAAEFTRSTTKPWRIALSGGTTARECYEILAGRDDIDWNAVECFMGDERCVGPDDPDANQRLVRESLLDRHPEARFHPMDCADVDGYNKLLIDESPLDFVHLGLGPDGHTASLFPDSPGLDAPHGVFAIHTEDPSGRNPHRRLTITLECIDLAHLSVFTVEGESKAEALGRILAGEDLPAARVRSQRVLWLADRPALGAAAAQLT